MFGCQAKCFNSVGMQLVADARSSIWLFPTRLFRSLECWDRRGGWSLRVLWLRPVGVFASALQFTQWGMRAD